VLILRDVDANHHHVSLLFPPMSSLDPLAVLLVSTCQGLQACTIPVGTPLALCLRPFQALWTVLAGSARDTSLGLRLRLWFLLSIYIPLTLLSSLLFVHCFALPATCGLYVAYICRILLITLRSSLFHKGTHFPYLTLLP
jgi:hypothetical protein